MSNANTSKLAITVRLVCGQVSVNGIFSAYKHTRIIDLKNQIIERFKEHLDADHEIRIIFAGHQLNDEEAIGEVDICDQTILHAVARKESTFDNSSTQTPSNSVDAGRTVTEGLEDSPSKAINYYYVYCKHTECSAIREAKLRVKCSCCNTCTVQVERDPQCWPDVLSANMIPVTCLANGCDAAFASFYFKCSGEVGQDSDGHSAVVLPQVTCNISQSPAGDDSAACVTCFELTNPVVSFDCASADASNHVMCLDCFKLYATHLLTTRQFIYHQQYGYTVQCPGKCEGSYIKDCHHFRVLGDELYNKYHTYGTEECLLQEGGVLCPHVGCGEGIFPAQQAAADTVHCLLGCQGSFCRRCLGSHPESGSECSGEAAAGSGPSHLSGPGPVSTRSLQHWQKQQSHDFIQRNTKKCPRCQIPTVRDGGCMHMTCVRASCKYNWCWVCEKEWNRDCQGSHWFG